MTEDLSADIDAWLSTDDDGDAPAAPLAVSEPLDTPSLAVSGPPDAPSLDVSAPLDTPSLAVSAPLDAPPLAVAAPLDAPRSLLEAIAALPGADEEPEQAPAAPAPVATRSVPRYVLFSVAGAHYAVPQPHVTELDRVPAFTVVPNVPAWVRGITNRRGDILSVVDTRTLLGLERLAADNGRMLVVRLLDDSCSLGLLVDEVHQIVSVPPGDVRDPGPGLDGPLAPFLNGLIELDQRTVAVLDLEGFLRSPLLRQFDEPDVAAQGHH